MDKTIQIEATGELVILEEDENNAFYRFEQEGELPIIMTMGVGRDGYPRGDHQSFKNAKMTITFER